MSMHVIYTGRRYVKTPLIVGTIPAPHRIAEGRLIQYILLLLYNITLQSLPVAGVILTKAVIHPYCYVQL